MIENMTSIIQLFLLDVTLNMLFDHTLTRKWIILGTLSKYHSSIRVSIASIYLAYLEIILLNHLFLIILKIRNYLLFVMNIINLSEVQYSISINWLLILILILRLQIHEIVKIQNSVTNLQAILLQEIWKSFQIQESVLLFQKGPKYRLPSQIDFNKCREEIAVALN